MAHIVYAPRRACAQSAEAFAAAAAAPGEPVEHTLPDGSVISLPASPLAAAGEALFDPRGMQGAPAAQPQAGLSEELLLSVKGCINDLRRQMCACGRAAGARALRQRAAGC